MTHPRTIAELLDARSADADHVFFVWDDARLSFDQAEAASMRLAQGLLNAGVTKGTRVGLLYPNSVDYVIAFLAAARIGAVATPFSTFSTPSELLWLLRNADVEVLLSASGYRNRNFREVITEALAGVDIDRAPILTPEAPSLRSVFIASAGQNLGFDPVVERTGLAPQSLVRAAERAVTPADRLVIVHTSGSTSDPKGVVHTHGGVMDHIDVLVRLRDLKPTDVLFSSSPLFWVGGLVYSLLSTMAARSRLLGSGASQEGKVLDLLERERPNLCNGFASGVLATLHKDPTYASRDLSFIRAGNTYPLLAPEMRPKDPELRHNMLGTTETASVWLFDPDESDLPETLRGSFGKPVPGAELRIVDADTGRECAVGEPGEMWVRGPFLMEGYYGRERADVFTPDGWYRTGDVAYVNADGYVFFKGRNNDMIKTAGANVSPREVEIALREVTGGLTAYVVGLQDAARGQIVAAGVVGARPEDIDLDALKPKLSAKLSAYKLPRKVVALTDAEVPLLSSGKVNMRALTELIRDR
jgi:acyl-CoA synthetase (AMP-forming)/AMP-acid ligase II